MMMENNENKIELSPLQIVMVIDNSIGIIDKHVRAIKLALPAVSVVEIDSELMKIQPMLQPLADYISGQIKKEKQVIKTEVSSEKPEVKQD